MHRLGSGGQPGPQLQGERDPFAAGEESPGPMRTECGQCPGEL